MSIPSKLITLISVGGCVMVGGIASAVYASEYLKLAQNESSASAPAKPRTSRQVEKKAAPDVATGKVIVSQKLIEAGAGCTGRIEAIARDSLGGTKGFVPVSSWLPREPKKHMVAVVVGQDFGSEGKVPHGLTGIVAAPAGSGGQCDGYAFQVMPSPLSCGEIQTNFLKSGERVADLAGFPLLRNAKSQVALMPAVGGPGCVVVSISLDY